MKKDFENFPLTRRKKKVDTSQFQELVDLQIGQHQHFTKAQATLNQLQAVLRALNHDDFHLTVKVVGVDDPKGEGFRVRRIVKKTRSAWAH